MPEGFPREPAEVLTEFAKIMTKQRGVDDVLEQLGAYCTELLPVDGVGILLRGADGRLQVATANSDKGRIVEHLEVELREGPCTESLETGQQVTVPDLERATERYPRFAPRALDAGVRSIHALPMTLRVEQVGSMDLISGDVVDLSSKQLAVGQMLADVALSYIVATRTLEESSKLAGQLQHALDSRILLEQAKGILSERHGITVSEAFDRLRTHARSTSSKIHLVAIDVIEGRLDL